MSDLKDHLEALHELDRVRTRAKELREQGLRSLRLIQRTHADQGHNTVVFATGKKLNQEEGDLILKNDVDFFGRWVCSNNEAEAALLAKIQNHHNLSEKEAFNDGAFVSEELMDSLTAIDLATLLPDPGRSDLDSTVPVLVATRTLEALAARPDTVFSKVSMLCYYRIVREIYYAASPDWTIGAARAGRGGRTSAFVTSECIRALLALEAAVARTANYLKDTLCFYERYLQLKAMLDGIGLKPDSTHELKKWADTAVERMWLDWYISTNQRNGAIGLSPDPSSLRTDPDDLLPLPPKPIEDPSPNMESVGIAFKLLKQNLRESIQYARSNIKQARTEIYNFRKENESSFPDGERLIHRTESAYLTAWKVIKNVEGNAKEAGKCANGKDLRECLKSLYNLFRAFPARIRRVLEPAKSYVDTVLDRELALAHSGTGFDAGELVFAATAYGGITNWQESEKLKHACDFLVQALPESGRFTTDRPFHADRRGYKLPPVGCEMTRSFAKLLQRTHYEFEPRLARRILGIFLSDRQFFLSAHEKDSERCAGWNFENAPHAHKPYVWVTAISVEALDRVVRMLNDRINEIAFKHFKVIRPDDHHSGLNLNELIYPDYGLILSNGKADDERKSIAIRLEQMRAHVMRASLPRKYKKDQEGNNVKVSSAILYGPPGTGKTTLVEALAFSGNVPLVMLSPSDLIVQGQEQLEARARAVFDALSMMSQVVILMDEFEPVLARRVPEASNIKRHEYSAAEEVTLEVAKAIREGGKSMLKFLVTGMLPKLVDLHEAAEKRSLVYCLATNHLEKIDEAAKRGGRFDVHQAIFNPDPLSRAGTFLFRLQSVAAKLDNTNAKFLGDRRKQQVFAQVVAATVNQNSGELSRRWFKTPKLEKKGQQHKFGEDREFTFFAHVLGKGIGRDWLEQRIKDGDSKLTKLAELESAVAVEQERVGTRDAEQADRQWLLDFEECFRKQSVSKTFSLTTCLSLSIAEANSNRRKRTALSQKDTMGERT